VPAGDADGDIDGESRLPHARDIGADEGGIVSGGPTAVIAAAPTTGLAPLAVAFDGSRSSDPSGTIVAYRWDFGDGVTGTGVTATHSYATAGQFRATLTVTNDRAQRASSSVSVVVVPPPKGPTITRQPLDRTVRPGGHVTFRVTAQGDGPLRYQWRRDGIDIPGATRPRYVTPAAIAKDDGATFQCVVSNGIGTVTSRAATLTVRRSLASVRALRQAAGQ
jgi:PKD repeat protein